MCITCALHEFLNYNMKQATFVPIDDILKTVQQEGQTICTINFF